MVRALGGLGEPGGGAGGNQAHLKESGEDSDGGEGGGVQGDLSGDPEVRGEQLEGGEGGGEAGGVRGVQGQVTDEAGKTDGDIMGSGAQGGEGVPVTKVGGVHAEVDGLGADVDAPPLELEVAERRAVVIEVGDDVLVGGSGGGGGGGATRGDSVRVPRAGEWLGQAEEAGRETAAARHDSGADGGVRGRGEGRAQVGQEAGGVGHDEEPGRGLGGVVVVEGQGA
jgi:hypothetical protein